MPAKARGRGCPSDTSTMLGFAWHCAGIARVLCGRLGWHSPASQQPQFVQLGFALQNPSHLSGTSLFAYSNSRKASLKVFPDLAGVPLPATVPLNPREWLAFGLWPFQSSSSSSALFFVFS